MTIKINAPPRAIRRSYPIDKILATLFGGAFCGVEIWLNAEHTAASSGWGSSLVAATILATAGAAAALPFMERAWAGHSRVKATGFFILFMLMAGFSMATSAGRLGTKHDAEVVKAKTHNAIIPLKQNALRAAQKTVESECRKRGPRCRDAEKLVQKLISELQAAPVTIVEDRTAQRIAASPLLLPLAMQLGGFLFIAYGLAPRRETPVMEAKPPEKVVETVTIPAAKSERDALQWFTRRIQRAEKQTLSGASIRQLSSECGIPHSTLSLWIRQWEKNGEVEVSRNGRKATYSLPRLRVLA